MQPALVQGSQALQAGDYGAAEKAFREALLVSPNSVEVLNDLAISLTREGKQDEAFATYRASPADQTGRSCYN